MRKDGFRPTSLSVQTVNDMPRFSAVAVKETIPIAWDFGRTKIDDSEYVDKMRKKDFVVVAQCLYREDKNLRQAYLWVHNPSGLNDGLWVGSKEHVEKKIDEAKTRKARPIFRSASEGATGVHDVVLGGPANTPWIEAADLSLADIKAWIDKHRAIGWRPDHLYAHGSGAGTRFGCILIQNADGPDWDVSWALTAAEYEKVLATRRANGFRPRHVVVHDSHLNERRFSVIWIRFQREPPQAP
ncbi:MAG: hypothetical protein FJ303_13665 [Planctomycetes bacterium]|nr:hypothetical protein [Planctomycetota bacterium]